MLVGMKRLIVVSTLVAALAVPATAGTASGTQPAVAKKAAATATAKAKAKRSAAKAKAARGAHGSGTCPFKSQAPPI